MIVYAGLTSYASIPDTGDATYAFVDATGSGVALATGSTRAWTAFDLHGNLAATTADSATTIVAALRYDPYGRVLDSYTAGSGATDTPWRFHGRLDLSSDADDPLYDYGARRYRPSLGAFTQLDSYAGQAINPLSMNRYLYAHANPTTLIDPTGHCAQCLPLIDGEVVTPKQGKQAKATHAAASAQAGAVAKRVATESSSTPVAPGPSKRLSHSQVQALLGLLQSPAPDGAEAHQVTLRNPGAAPWWADAGIDPSLIVPVCAGYTETSGGGACPLMLSGGPHTVSEFERVGTAAAAIALMALFGIAAFPGVVADIGTLPPAAWWTVHSTTVFGVAEGLSGAPPGAISTIPVGTKFPMGTVVDNPQIAITGLRGSTQPYHAVERILERGVTPTQIVNAVRNPTVALSQDGGSRFVFVTPDAAVVMRADGQIVTVWGAAQHDARYLQLLLEAGVGH